MKLKKIKKIKNRQPYTNFITILEPAPTTEMDLDDLDDKLDGEAGMGRQKRPTGNLKRQKKKKIGI